MTDPAGSECWSSRTGFVLATIGSAVGLASIWKFPYELGENGGAGFLIFYLLGLVLVVAPLLLAEFVIGRRGQADAATSVSRLAQDAGASPCCSGSRYDEANAGERRLTAPATASHDRAARSSNRRKVRQ
ncbi:MAG: hypothetical protein WD711_11075 [Dongiaceae bacterium]